MKVWFNHWFSTAYNLIELIKQENPSVEIIGSSENKNAVYKLLCTEFFIEPQFENEDEYSKWCLNFCLENKINLFIPRKGRKSISKILKQFNDNNIKVMLDDNSELIDILEDKIKTAELFKSLKICNVPEMLIAENITEFEQNYKYLKTKYPNDRICFKYAKDEGATSFRVIDDIVENIDMLKKGRGSKISYDEAKRILDSVNSFEPLIQMIYLKGIEISIDSLMTKKGFVGCVRYKEGGRVTRIEHNSEFISISKEFAEKTNIKHPYNLQLIFHDEVPYLLEVNTRMAGGTHKCNLAGINFPSLALCDLMNKDFELPTELKNVILTQIETPLLLE